MGRRACDYFNEGMERLIEYVRMEYKMTFAELVGCLEMKKADLMAEAAEIAEERDDE